MTQHAQRGPTRRGVRPLLSALSVLGPAPAPAAVGVAPPVAGAAPTCTTTGPTTTCTLPFIAPAPDGSGGVQPRAVPAGVTEATSEVLGAPGGPGAAAAGGPGGLGGRVAATLPVTPGSTFDIRVGGRGADGTVPTGAARGGSSGGGNGGAGQTGGGGGGGGASDVRPPGGGLPDRVLVAAGGPWGRSAVSARGAGEEGAA